jgi:hypothetical protein
VADRIRIAEIRIDPTIEFKILHKVPGVSPAEVREALVYRRDARAAWEHHPEHGLRVVARGSTAVGDIIVAVLLPVEGLSDTWILKTARKPH